jgi:hypothetical protein
MAESASRDTLIELKLRDLRQLFHHLDPAPFAEKDLDPAAEAWIEDSVRELGPGRALRLRIWLPPEQVASADAGTLPVAIQNYFAARARQLRLELNQLLRRALTNLLIGVTFLAVCLTLRESLVASGRFELLSEGLLIIGWVALWRPVENFLYDWWPVARRIRRLTRISRIPVEVSTLEGAAGPVRDSRALPDL